MAVASITDVPGVRVGHWTDLAAGTGCTVILCESGPVTGVDVRGASPATRETDVLRPGTLVGRAHAILLTGGSAYGLDAAGGVMRYLEEHGKGFQTYAGLVPIVPAAALFDLGVGRADVRPDASAGYAACCAASAQVEEGSVGAGTGATVAKTSGLANAMKGGIGTAARVLPDGTRVGALVAVNAAGLVYEAATGEAIARPRAGATGAGRTFAATNTTIGVIATTAPLDTSAVNRLAMIGHDGLALAIRPAHTQVDGDALFALSLPAPEAQPADIIQLAIATVEAVAEAVVRGVRTATSLHGIPAVRDL